MAVPATAQAAFGRCWVSYAVRYRTASTTSAAPHSLTALPLLHLWLQVWVKVVEVQPAEGDRQLRIGCSIKLVDQKDGSDLDPYGHKWVQQLGGRVVLGVLCREVVCLEGGCWWWRMLHGAFAAPDSLWCSLALYISPLRPPHCAHASPHVVYITQGTHTCTPTPGHAGTSPARHQAKEGPATSP